MTSNKPRVDPRFDPIFQRGYQGGVRNTGVRQVSRATSPPSPAPEPEPTATSEVPPPARQQHPDASVADPVQPMVITEYPASEPAKPRRSLNPFIVLLWIVGPALIGGGASATYQSAFRNMSGWSGPDQMALQQVIWMAGPAAITVGLGIIAGLLFWHAAAWRARSAP